MANVKTAYYLRPGDSVRLRFVWGKGDKVVPAGITGFVAEIYATKRGKQLVDVQLDYEGQVIEDIPAYELEVIQPSEHLDPAEAKMRVDSYRRSLEEKEPSASPYVVDQLQQPAVEVAPKEKRPRKVVPTDKAEPFRPRTILDFYSDIINLFWQGRFRGVDPYDRVNIISQQFKMDRDDAQTLYDTVVSKFEKALPKEGAMRTIAKPKPVFDMSQVPGSITKQIEDAFRSQSLEGMDKNQLLSWFENALKTAVDSKTMAPETARKYLSDAKELPGEYQTQSGRSINRLLQFLGNIMLSGIGQKVTPGFVQVKTSAFLPGVVVEYKTTGAKGRVKGGDPRRPGFTLVEFKPGYAPISLADNSLHQASVHSGITIRYAKFAEMLRFFWANPKLKRDEAINAAMAAFGTDYFDTEAAWAASVEFPRHGQTFGKQAEMFEYFNQAFLKQADSESEIFRIDLYNPTSWDLRMAFMCLEDGNYDAILENGEILVPGDQVDRAVSFLIGKGFDVAGYGPERLGRKGKVATAPFVEGDTVVAPDGVSGVVSEVWMDRVSVWDGTSTHSYDWHQLKKKGHVNLKGTKIKLALDQFAKGLYREYLKGTGYDVQIAKVSAASPEAQDWISNKIRKLINEGKSQEQAAAIAYSMAREKGYKVPEKKSSEEKKAVDTFAKSYWSTVFKEMGADDKVVKSAMDKVSDLMKQEASMKPVEFKTAYDKMAEEFKGVGGLGFVRRIRLEALRHKYRDHRMGTAIVHRSDDSDILANNRKLRGCYHILDNDVACFHFGNRDEYKRIKGELGKFEPDFLTPEGWDE